MSNPLLTRMKDSALEKAFLLAIKPRLARYGEIRRFTLDSAAGRFEAEIALHGEATPLVVSEAHYRFERADGQTIAILHDMKVSRPWVQNLLDDHFREIRFKLPGFVSTLLG